MNAILLLLPQIIALIPTVTTGVREIVSFVEGVRAAAQQSSEWTPELEKAFVESLIARAKSDAWKTDSQVGL
jgi:hypothetical protein